MVDHAFQRRREIERMLLSGKKLTVAELMGRYCVGRKSISRDFEIIGEELPVVSKQGYNGGYFLMDGVGQHQNSLSHEQLECLEKLAVICAEKDRETVLSIIHEFGPYCETMRELAWELDVSRRTIMNDVTVLSFDYPIYTKSGEGGGVFITENYKPYANTLTQTELETLCRIYGRAEGKEKEILFRIIHKYGADKLEL